METLSANNIFIDVEARDQNEIFEKIALAAKNLGYVDNAAAVINELKAREILGSTGMEAGFAIPHALCEAVKEAGVIIMRLSKAVEWETFDGEPVDFVIALLAPKNASTEHLRLLSGISAMLVHEEVRQKLKNAKSAEEIFAFIAEKLK